MKIIYAGVRKEQYNSKRGFSFEYNNFYRTLQNMSGIEVVEIPYDLITEIGRKGFNKMLLEKVKSENPNALFAFMATDDLDTKVLDEINKRIITIAWFADDHWRLYNYSRHYAPHFRWVVTTWSGAPAEYLRYGIQNVIRSQWACNPHLWKPQDVVRDIDVSFVGQYNPSRGRMIEELKRSGIDVWTRGWGWPDGRLSEDEMIKTFSRSKINLNLNNQPPKFSPKQIARLFFKRSQNRIVPDFWHFADNLRSLRHLGIPQIKARPFELAACRTFVISGYADDLENYYQENEEMVFYRSVIDLVEKIKHYLSREDERERIARAGYERTIKEHTYEKRFKEIFTRIGLY